MSPLSRTPRRPSWPLGRLRVAPLSQSQHDTHLEPFSFIPGPYVFGGHRVTWTWLRTTWRMGQPMRLRQAHPLIHFRTSWWVLLSYGLRSSSTMRHELTLSGASRILGVIFMKWCPDWPKTWCGPMTRATRMRHWLHSFSVDTMPPRHISATLDTQLMVAADGVMVLWTTTSTVSFIALALSFWDNSFAQRLRRTRVGFLDGIGMTIRFSFFASCAKCSCALCGGWGRVISLGLGGCKCGFWDTVDVMPITVIVPHGLLVWGGFFLWCGWFWVASAFIDMLGIGFRGKCFMTTCPLLGFGCGVFLCFFACIVSWGV